MGDERDISPRLETTAKFDKATLCYPRVASNLPKTTTSHFTRAWHAEVIKLLSSSAVRKLQA